MLPLAHIFRLLDNHQAGTLPLLPPFVVHNFERWSGELTPQSAMTELHLLPIHLPPLPSLHSPAPFALFAASYFPHHAVFHHSPILHRLSQHTSPMFSLPAFLIHPLFVFPCSLLSLFPYPLASSASLSRLLSSSPLLFFSSSLR